MGEIAAVLCRTEIAAVLANCVGQKFLRSSSRPGSLSVGVREGCQGRSLAVGPAGCAVLCSAPLLRPWGSGAGGRAKWRNSVLFLM